MMRFIIFWFGLVTAVRRVEVLVVRDCTYQSGRNLRVSRRACMLVANLPMSESSRAPLRARFMIGSIQLTVNHPANVAFSSRAPYRSESASSRREYAPSSLLTSSNGTIL